MSAYVRAPGRDPAARPRAQLSTQAELVEALRDEGFDAVQTTVSRDIAQLGLVKVRPASGQPRRDCRLPTRCSGSRARAAALTRSRSRRAQSRRWS